MLLNAVPLWANILFGVAAFVAGYWFFIVWCMNTAAKDEKEAELRDNDTGLNGVLSGTHKN